MVSSDLKIWIEKAAGSPAAFSDSKNSNTLNRQTRLANNMLGAELDFIIREMEEKSRSVVAFRKEAMLRKRQQFYLGQQEGPPMIVPGRVVEARVIAVAQKAVRSEVFGVECSLKARDMSWEWMADTNEKFSIGDVVSVMMMKISGDSIENLKVEVSPKEAKTKGQQGKFNAPAPPGKICRKNNRCI